MGGIEAAKEEREPEEKITKGWRKLRGTRRGTADAKRQ